MSYLHWMQVGIGPKGSPNQSSASRTFKTATDANRPNSKKIFQYFSSLRWNEEGSYSTLMLAGGTLWSRPA